MFAPKDSDFEMGYEKTMQKNPQTARIFKKAAKIKNAIRDIRLEQLSMYRQIMDKCDDLFYEHQEEITRILEEYAVKIEL